MGDNLTQQAAQDLFTYDEASGLLLYRVDRKNVSAGTVAGYCRKDGYQVVCVKKRRYYAHRIIWLMINGAFPPDKMDIDHIDGNKRNNRIQNLRVVTRSQNNQNMKRLRVGKTSKHIGVCWMAREGKWAAYIKVGNKRMSLGYHDTELLAHAAYSSAKTKYHIGA